MAIDTKQKRAAVVGVGRPYLRSKRPQAKDAAWRASSGNSYAKDHNPAAMARNPVTMIT